MSLVLVTGATGQIGIFVLPRLLETGARVLAVTRRLPEGQSWQPPVTGGRLTWIGAGAPGPGVQASARFEDVESLLSAGPLPLALAWSAACPSLRRIVCFSSSSVLIKEHSPDRRERAVIRDLLEAEAQVRAMAAERNVPLALLRPTLIYGCGLDRNVSRIAAIARRLRALPLAGAARGLRQPVHADDLAALAVAILGTVPAVHMETVAPGGDTLDYRGMARRVFEAFGLQPRTPGVPESLLAAVARSVGALAGRDGPGAEAVRRQNRDLRFDSDVWECFGVRPRPFRPTPADFSIPASAAALQPGSRPGTR